MEKNHISQMETLVQHNVYSFFLFLLFLWFFQRDINFTYNQLIA